MMKGTFVPYGFILAPIGASLVVLFRSSFSRTVYWNYCWVGRKLRLRARNARGLWSLPNYRNGESPIRSGYKDRHAHWIPPASNPVRILASSRDDPQGVFRTNPILPIT